MNYTDFIGEVQHRIEGSTRAEAVRTTRAVLETLGERIGEGGATDIASPLPMEIDRYLLQVDHGQQFGFDEFIQRVMQKIGYDDLDLETAYGRPAGIDEADAVYQSKAVIALLEEMLPGEELANVKAQLPGEFEQLFEFVNMETEPWAQQ